MSNEDKKLKFVGKDEQKDKNIPDGDKNYPDGDTLRMPKVICKAMIPYSKIKAGHDIVKYYHISVNARGLSENYVNEMLVRDTGVSKHIYCIYWKKQDIYYIVDGQHVFEKERRKGRDCFEISILEGDASNISDVMRALNFSVGQNTNNRSINVGNQVRDIGRARDLFNSYNMEGDYSKWIKNNFNRYDFPLSKIRKFGSWYPKLNIRYIGRKEWGTTLLDICEELEFRHNVVQEIAMMGDVAMDKYISDPAYNKHLNDERGKDYVKEKILKKVKLEIDVDKVCMKTLENTKYIECINRFVNDSMSLFTAFKSIDFINDDNMEGVFNKTHHVEELTESLESLHGKNI